MELLAPARDLEALNAAIDAGADAVYCGLVNFSARKRARNFTEEELLQAVEITRRTGKRLYVTLNTLVFESEIPELLETLVFLQDAKIDALIIQDYGVYRMIRDLGFGIPLHASTQMGTKNHLQAQFLEQLGFRRVILERQLTLDEIGSIRSATGVELEVFIHGALCYSLSGCCFFSRMLTGRSGNRGECAQPCRWQFKDGTGHEQYPFSMKDLDGIRQIPVLREMGVNSLKIEGRMKGIEYVYPVVSAYRKALDLLSRNRLSASEMEELQREIGEATLSRTAGSGFFDGLKKEVPIVDKTGGGTGIYLGKTAAVFGRALYFKTGPAFRVGDTLRVTDKKTDRRFKIPVKAIYRDNNKVRECTPGSYVGIPSPHSGISEGSQIHLVHRRSSYKIKKLVLPLSGVRTGEIKERVKRLFMRYRELYRNSNCNATVEDVSFPAKGETCWIAGERAIVLCPAVYESETGQYRDAARADAAAVVVSHPCEPALLRGKRCHGSIFLHATNAAAIRFMRERGIENLSVPPDMDDEEFGAVRGLAEKWIRWKGIPLWLTRVDQARGVYTLKTDRSVRILIAGPLGLKK